MGEGGSCFYSCWWDTLGYSHRGHQIHAEWLDSTWKTYICKLKPLVDDPSHHVGVWGSNSPSYETSVYDRGTKAVFYMLLKSKG